MSEEIILYYNPMSRARIAHWMLEEVGTPYRIELVSLEKREQKQPTFLAVNPMGKLPAIVHRSTVVTESGAICAYLADAFPAARLAPRNEEAIRGTYLRWMFFGAGCLEPALIDRLLERPPPERASSNGYGTYDDTLNTLEKALHPGPYIRGDRFSAADDPPFLQRDGHWAPVVRHGRAIGVKKLPRDAPVIASKVRRAP